MFLFSYAGQTKWTLSFTDNKGPPYFKVAAQLYYLIAMVVYNDTHLLIPAEIALDMWYSSLTSYQTKFVCFINVSHFLQ